MVHTIFAFTIVSNYGKDFFIQADCLLDQVSWRAQLPHSGQLTLQSGFNAMVGINLYLCRYK